MVRAASSASLAKNRRPTKQCDQLFHARCGLFKLAHELSPLRLRHPEDMPVGQDLKTSEARSVRACTENSVTLRPSTSAAHSMSCFWRVVILTARRSPLRAGHVTTTHVRRTGDRHAHRHVATPHTASVLLRPGRGLPARGKHRVVARLLEYLVQLPTPHTPGSHHRKAGSTWRCA